MLHLKTLVPYLLQALQSYRCETGFHRTCGHMPKISFQQVRVWKMFWIVHKDPYWVRRCKLRGIASSIFKIPGADVLVYREEFPLQDSGYVQIWSGSHCSVYPRWASWGSCFEVGNGVRCNLKMPCFYLLRSTTGSFVGSPMYQTWGRMVSSPECVENPLCTMVSCCKGSDYFYPLRLGEPSGLPLFSWRLMKPPFICFDKILFHILIQIPIST